MGDDYQQLLRSRITFFLDLPDRLVEIGEKWLRLGVEKLSFRVGVGRRMISATG